MIENLIAAGIGVALWPLAAVVTILVPLLVPDDILDVMSEQADRFLSTEDVFG